MGSANPKPDSVFMLERAGLDDVEARLGEMAAYLSDIADGLSHDPDGLPRLLTNPWPDLAELHALREEWLEHRDALMSSWRAMDPSFRKLHRLPPFGSVDRSRAVV